MIEAKLMESDGILVVQPRDTLQAEDFKQLSLLADPYIEKHGKLNGLLIDVETFPGWDDFASLIDHIDFVRDHEHNVKRVAAVSNDKLVSVLPRIANSFVDAEVQHFDFQDRDKAYDWLRESGNSG